MDVITVPLYEIAYARSGDKGVDANIGVIAYTKEGYFVLTEQLTKECVQSYFQPLGVKETIRYLLPNLFALNFVLKGVLDGGGRSLRVDAQGKALGGAILEIPIDVKSSLIPRCKKPDGLN